MAFVTTTNSPSLLDRIRSASHALATRYRQHRLYRETFEGLSALSNRELTDLGLSRYDLRRVAWDSSHR